MVCANPDAIADAGTVYFTSIRPSQSDPWRIGELTWIGDP